MTSRDSILANAQIVVRELMAEPNALPLKSACAVAGNGWQENLMQPVTRGAKDHGSDGLLQWRLDRLENLQKLKDWDTLPVQCQFFKWECQKFYPTLWAQLMNPGGRSLENLVANVCDQYERPSAAGRVLDRRIGYARQVMKLYDTAAPEPKEVPKPLEPAVNGTVSTSFGALAWVVAWFIYHGYATATAFAGEGWLSWVVIGAVLIFAVGPRSQKPAELPPKETEMDKLIALIGVMEQLAPVVMKLAEDVPAIKDRLTQLESALTAATVADPSVSVRIDELAKKLGGGQ